MTPTTHTRGPSGGKAALGSNEADYHFAATLPAAPCSVGVPEDRALIQIATTGDSPRAGNHATLGRGARAPYSVSALFVQKDGCYFNLDGVDPWDEARDARKYNGPYPVVAHPPCQRWGALAAVNYARWGGEHNRPGNDDGCFKSALDSVNKFGGALEHPAKTRAWAEYGLNKPLSGGWLKSGKGWVCEVWQSAYGHRANKATWLYYVGLRLPKEFRWNRPRGSHQVGFQDHRGKAANKPTLSKREANATPLEFRNELLSLAMLAPIPSRGVTAPFCLSDFPGAECVGGFSGETVGGARWMR